MTRDDLRIVGDWGSSAMRLHLCRRRPGGLEVLETVHGAGAKDVTDHEAAFRAAAGPWLAAHGPLPVLLSGMIGSTIGWREAAYLPCPADAADLAAALTRFTAGDLAVAIVPGLACTNLFGLPDVMRGEEVQLFGWLADMADDAAKRVICLPGTHAKWVRTRGRRVLDFVTSMQGELHELLLRHSLLGRSLEAPWDPAAPIDDAEFDHGVGLIADHPAMAIEHVIFSLRGRILVGALASAAAPSYLSGLLIGAELRDGMAAHRAHGAIDGPLVLIGGARLVDLYHRAAGRLGIDCRPVVDHDIALAGLAALAA